MTTLLTILNNCDIYDILISYLSTTDEKSLKKSCKTLFNNCKEYHKYKLNIHNNTLYMLIKKHDSSNITSYDKKNILCDKIYDIIWNRNGQTKTNINDYIYNMSILNSIWDISDANIIYDIFMKHAKIPIIKINKIIVEIENIKQIIKYHNDMLK